MLHVPKLNHWMILPVVIVALACLAPALPVRGQLLAESQPEIQRPNIIIVMADDMGFSDLGCYGSEIKTPTIDRLASEGLRFSQFYNCAICGPSRASLMTGCYPWQVGQKPGVSIFANLNKNCATLLEVMKANSYTTCAVGRLDMAVGGDWHDPAQIAKHVDRFLGSASGGPGNYYKQVKGSPWFKDGKVWDRPAGAYSTDLISQYVDDFIASTKDSDKPFFLYVSHYAPHWPLQAEKKDIAPYRALYQKKDRQTLMRDRLRRQIKAGLIPEGTTLPASMLNPKADRAAKVLPIERMAIHAAMIESMDRSLADTMAALKKANKLQNTLIFVFSDNGASHQLNFDRAVPDGVRPGSGESFLNHGSALAALSNTPFRNYKVSNYEGGIASPLIAYWPAGLKEPGRIEHTPWHIADFMPTCLELAGIQYPSAFEGRQLIPLVGTSLKPVLNNDADQEASRVLVWPKAIRAGDWKLVLGARPELYRIDQDRNEQMDLAAQFPDRVEELQRLHKKHYSPE
ncbi:MAG: sulfatase-like hydrolase/transferase [Mariniblastus sp.]|nr:sulfatase-like hydrolase/transferase [Mariniblastus sp.]